MHALSLQLVQEWEDVCKRIIREFPTANGKNVAMQIVSTVMHVVKRHADNPRWFD